MRILVDSSAWIDFLNDHPSPVTDEVSALLGEPEHELCTCGPIVAEVLQGLRRPAGVRAVTEMLRKLTFLEVTGFDLFADAASLFRSLRARGVVIRSTVDCLLAVLAQEQGCWLLARDRDLERIAASGLVRVSHWPPPAP